MNRSKLVARDISESLGKLPPQAIDMEEAVLGAALFERQAQIVMLEKLIPEDFYLDSHKEVFTAVKDLADAGHPVDIRTVRHQLEKVGKIELVGGVHFLVELTNKVSSAANTEYNCLILMEKRMAREIIQFASQLHQDAYDPEEDVFKIVDAISAFPLQLMDKIKAGSERLIKEGIDELVKDINTRKEDHPDMTGLASGYENIDTLTGGWQEGNLIILAARPSMGKTTIAINFLRNAAVDFKEPVGMFSMEMSYKELVRKFVSLESDIDLKKITSKVFEPLDWTRFMNTTGPLMEAKIYIDDTATVSISDFRHKARRMVEKFKVKFIVVDYLQLMRGEFHTIKNREQEISSITRGLKATAKELKIPIMALAQLSRDVEKRQSPKIPMLSDLRESGSIEQDADIVMFPYRPGYYNYTSDTNGVFVEGLTKLIFAKHRNGALDPSPCLRGNLKTSKFIPIESPYNVVPTVQTTIDRQDPAPLFSQTKDNDDTPF